MRTNWLYGLKKKIKLFSLRQGLETATAEACTLRFYSASGPFRELRPGGTLQEPRRDKCQSLSFQFPMRHTALPCFWSFVQQAALAETVQPFRRPIRRTGTNMDVSQRSLRKRYEMARPLNKYCTSKYKKFLKEENDIDIINL